MRKAVIQNRAELFPRGGAAFVRPSTSPLVVFSAHVSLAGNHPFIERTFQRIRLSPFIRRSACRPCAAESASTNSELKTAKMTFRFCRIFTALTASPVLRGTPAFAPVFAVTLPQTSRSLLSSLRRTGASPLDPLQILTR